MFKRRRADFYGEVLGLLQDAGYNDLTMFQKLVMPYIFRDRNVIVNTFRYPGKTAAFILPLLIKLKKNVKGIKAVILTSKAFDIKKIFKEINLFKDQRKLKPVMLNENDNIKAEIKYLNMQPDIIISTPKRLIDHIRQKNLGFDNLERTVILDTEDEPDSLFYDDLQFIFSKFPQKQQIILYSQNNILDIKNPVIITDRNFDKIKTVHYVYDTTQEDKLKLLADIILSKNLNNFLIFCNSGKNVKEIHDFLKLYDIKTIKLPIKVNIPYQAGFITWKSTNIKEQLKHVQITSIINFTIPDDGKEYLKRCGILQSKKKQVFNLASGNEIKILNNIQEKCKVETKKEKTPTQKEVFKGTIQNILRIIKEEEDPEELNKYRKIVKQNVPIFLRAYFSAYLFKQSLGKMNLIEEKKNGYTTLFISIGKNRRVYPKDLLQLFTTNLNISNSDIGEIKIFDNYSFLDISIDHASKAITKLSNINYRGRNLKVNLARKKGKTK